MNPGRTGCIMPQYRSRTRCVMRQYVSHTADVQRSSRVRSLAVPRSYRGHQEYVACQHSRHISNERLMDVFLRRHQSGRIKHLQESHSGQVLRLLQRENCENLPMIKSKDEPATRAAPHFTAVPSAYQQAGTPRSGTTAATAGRTTERRHPTSRPASVNHRTRKGTKQRTKALQRPLLLFTKPRI